MFKVRFHLGAGKNFGHWQIKEGWEKPIYVNSEDVCLEMYNARLVNHIGSAKKILCGASKSVCAWIVCEKVLIHTPEHYIDNSRPQLSYNPKVIPNWVGLDGRNMDGDSGLCITTYKKRLFYTSSLLFA